MEESDKEMSELRSWEIDEIFEEVKESMHLHDEDCGIPDNYRVDWGEEEHQLIAKVAIQITGFRLAQKEKVKKE